MVQKNTQTSPQGWSFGLSPSTVACIAGALKGEGGNREKKKKKTAKKGAAHRPLFTLSILKPPPLFMCLLRRLPYHPFGISRVKLHTFLQKFWLNEIPSPLGFPMTILGVGMDIFWNQHIKVFIVRYQSNCGTGNLILSFDFLGCQQPQIM